MRLLDDFHQLVVDFGRLVALAERYAAARLRGQGASPAVAQFVAEGANAPFTSKPEYYDEQMVIALNEATNRYVTNHGEWPSDEQRRLFVEQNIDFSQE